MRSGPTGVHSAVGITGDSLATNISKIKSNLRGNMAFLYIVEILLQILIVTGVITQVILPLLQGGKLWPFFRRKDIRKERTEAEELLERVRERDQVDRIVDEVVDWSVRKQGMNSHAYENKENRTDDTN